MATRRHHIPEATHEGYRVYTTDFDVVAKAGPSLDAVLGAPTFQEKLVEYARWMNFRVTRAMLTREFRAPADRFTKLLAASLPAEARRHTVATLLVDHSGSLRGRPAIQIAASLHLVVQLLQSLGVRTEVLGFTTSQWQGGHARRRWKANGKPAEPGRLNDLLHIVYRDAIEMDSVRSDMLRPMLRPELLKENIDGEAVEWAERRLVARPETRKLLVLVSDGAPVDDSTLHENGEGYLHRHLKAVVQRIEGERKIVTGAVAIPDPSGAEFFANTFRIDRTDRLGPALLQLLERMMTAGHQ